MAGVVCLRSAKDRKASGAAGVRFNKKTATLLLKYARMLVARGYIHNTLGNIAIRVPHPGFKDGIVYTKHAEVSLEEMTLNHVVITDIPFGTLLYGSMPTSVGHQLNREIFRLRSDINAVIHIHHDETIAFFASGAFKEVKVLSLEFPCVLARPPHLLPSHVDVEQDVSPVREFIQQTNAVIMENHGITTLGRTISEAYHRLNTVTAEVRRNILAELLASARGTEVRPLDSHGVEWIYQHADRIIYPSRADEGKPKA